MAVDRLDAAAAVADSTTLSYAISAGSNRALIVAVTQEEDGTLEAPTVSYGGQSLGAFAAASGILIDGGTQVAIHYFRLLEVGIAAASDTTITVAGATLTAKAIHARSYINVDQVDPITPVNGADYEETGGATPNPLVNCAVDVEAGGACVACGLTGQNSATGTWANVTEQTELVAGATMGSSLADSLEAGAATVNPQRTWGSQNRAIVAAIALAPAADEVEGTGSATGTSTAPGVGASGAEAAGSAAGTGAASAVGASEAGAAGSAAGTSTAAAVGESEGTPTTGGMVPARRKRRRGRYQTPDGREFNTAQEAADWLVLSLLQEQAEKHSPPL